jgi:hypothetical protein
MKLAVRLLVAALCVSFAAGYTARAQVAYNEGKVERIILLHITPGHQSALLADLKKNGTALWEAEKKAGLLEDYQLFFNTTSSGPEDWDIGISLVYKNMAALDGLADKVQPLIMQHYGDASAEQKVVDKRVENAHVVSSMIIRDITLR